MKRREPVVLIIDTQHDFVSGSLAVPEGRDVVPVVRDLLQRRWNWTLVVASQDWHPAGHISFASSHPGQKAFKLATVTGKGGVEVEQMLWPDHCLQNTKGAELDPGLLEAIEPWKAAGKFMLTQKGTDKLVEAYSAFDAEGTPRLDERLRALGVEQLVVVGLATDYCVKQSVLSACQLGFQVIVVPEAVRGVDAKGSEEAMQAMTAAGAKIVPIGELAATWPTS